MISHKGNIFEGLQYADSPVILLHQVNCCSVMGAGIAKQIKELYPSVFNTYLNHLSQFADVRVGRFVTKPDALGTIDVSPVDDGMLVGVVNIFGQMLYGKSHKHTSYDALDCAFNSVSEMFSDADVEFHFPKIGCGLGGGDWLIVKSIIESKLDTSKLHCWSE